MEPSTPIPQRKYRHAQGQVPGEAFISFHRRADRSHRQSRRQRARTGRIPCLCHLGLRRRDHARRRAYRRCLLGEAAVIGVIDEARRFSDLQLPRRLLRPADGRRHRCRPGDAAARDAGLLGACWRPGICATTSPRTGHRSAVRSGSRHPRHRLRAGPGGVHRNARARADAHQRQRRAG